MDRGNEPILPIYVSNFNINRAYRIVDSLINTLDEMEGRILVRRISEKDIGGFLIMHTIFYFEVEEEVNKVKAKKRISESKNILVMSIKAEGYLNSNIVEQLMNLRIESRIGNGRRKRDNVA
ncbi:hypothetical protein LL037_16555 [Clostridium estertheticum]|uniref:Uncharacterized protein n=1 Tax=Clostridium estertheticum TaxID=238834 RepID=A0AA47EKE2_9CLOT|nr:hypothetical protein [Clostridium estertheticum]MBU3154622.1 hypothetical protein [Clostridium estertheticum]MBU3198769.1 hypothetical protein [Clostridium estertheticum]WAG61801.1 hypothetical protein LL038_06025 [Clostridium estertheticum]WAG64078.1 hypothetical protein LL037_16555 [Clostridium estertheticum]